MSRRVNSRSFQSSQQRLPCPRSSSLFTAAGTLELDVLQIALSSLQIETTARGSAGVAPAADHPSSGETVDLETQQGRGGEPWTQTEDSILEHLFSPDPDCLHTYTFVLWGDFPQKHSERSQRMGWSYTSSEIADFLNRPVGEVSSRLRSLHDRQLCRIQGRDVASLFPRDEVTPLVTQITKATACWIVDCYQRNWDVTAVSSITNRSEATVWAILMERWDARNKGNARARRPLLGRVWSPDGALVGRARRSRAPISTSPEASLVGRARSLRTTVARLRPVETQPAMTTSSRAESSSPRPRITRSRPVETHSAMTTSTRIQSFSPRPRITRSRPVETQSVITTSTRTERSARPGINRTGPSPASTTLRRVPEISRTRVSPHIQSPSSPRPLVPSPRDGLSQVASAPRNSGECVICLSNRHSYASIPCGHMAYCGDCAAIMKQRGNGRMPNCALCRARCDSIIRIYC
ncbi:hypothetical protein M427DRAFT_131526 [Gonapodya prolifera JEL478]|uniref:RING-type domain-containing protein n=1 Tax=Gonapodya prolifera (strain JEL478) TaxID=1344416 RepID=A0A139ATU6_GONPJ|nr:hypothetical protein M427DRAFT_131526 [Gonapodya prolifera JEL478]|eukprot:KXS20119.1 hypothetical protein M427DRAFT_131526 [Gonapodya prolifera JEL478]